MSLLSPGVVSLANGLGSIVAPAATVLASHSAAGFASLSQGSSIAAAPKGVSHGCAASSEAAAVQQAVPRQQVQAFRLTLAAAAAARRPLISRGFAASAAPVAGGDAADREVVDAVLSCASGTTCELPADKGVLARLAACAAEQAPALSPDQIRNLLVSFAQLKYHNIPFKTAMVDAIISKMGQFEPAALADAAWAFGQAEYYDYELMSQLMTYLRDNADRFDASSMAKLLWLFGRAGYQDAALMDLMHSIALKLQGAMDTESIAEVMFAEAQLGWADPRLQALVADYALDNMAAFDSSSLAKMTYGLTAVGYEDPDLYQAVCDRALQLLPDMVPADVALVMWSVGEQGFWHSPFLSAVADSYIPDHQGRFTPQQLQVLVVAFNKLGFSSPAVAAAALQLSQVLPGLAPEFPDAEDSPAAAVLKDV